MRGRWLGLERLERTDQAANIALLGPPFCKYAREFDKESIGNIVTRQAGANSPQLVIYTGHVSAVSDVAGGWTHPPTCSSTRQFA
jgi:hypothetical protein